MVEIMTKTYTVTAERGSGPVWVLQCQELGAVSQTRRLDKAADEMREAIAYQAGLSPDEVHIVVHPILPPEIAESKAYAEEKTREEEIRATAARSRRAVALRRKASGFTARDIGVILGVSYQRAAQLAAG